MNKYEFCKNCNCDKFKEEEATALRINNSAFDAAIDMWNFVDKQYLECPILKKALAEGEVDKDYFIEMYHR